MTPFFKKTLLVFLCLLTSVLFAEKDNQENNPNTLLKPVGITIITDSEKNIPDKLGRAGMTAGSIFCNSNKTINLILGGANFPYAKTNAQTATERGAKVFYNDIFIETDSGWDKFATLPFSVGYAISANIQTENYNGLIVAGGCNESGHLKKVILISANKTIDSLPDLPISLAYAAGTSIDGKFYVFGGQETDKHPTSEKNTFVLDLNKKDLKWETLPQMPGNGRILSAIATDKKTKLLYLLGGCEVDKNGQRTYLKNIICFNSSSNNWSKNIFTDIPETFAASPSPAPIIGNSIFLFGGDNGDFYRASIEKKAPSIHPGQSPKIYSYDIEKNTWKMRGAMKIASVTAPTLIEKRTEIITPIKEKISGIRIISGETHPGIRTPICQTVEQTIQIPATTNNIIDILVISLMAIIIVVIIIQAKIKGLKNIKNLTDPNSKPGLWAWIAVILLWIVVMLNYFDRQLLAVVREPVMEDIEMNMAEFGLITAVFLLIYAILSPVGGYLADKFSRRLVILCSLVVWSTVTWWTGHAENYTSLFIARAAMGISEAFYIPAALALITDFHRGKTRSIATGIHMSGIYVGMALAGYGGSMSDFIGWRITFAFFGLIGVLYAIILILFLRDPGDKLIDKVTPISTNEVKSSEEKITTKIVLSSLLKTKAMWMLLCILALGGAANWFLLTWYPTLLQEAFGLTAGEAGPQATLWSSIAKYVAVIAGAIIADRWVQHNLKARALVPGISFVIAGPCIILAIFLVGQFSGAVWLLPLVIGLIATQGLAQGTMDATLMPVMRSHIDERFSATGYGLLNLTSAGVGSLTVFLAGWLKDLDIALTTSLQFAGGMMFVCGIMFLLIPKPQK